MPVKNFGNVLVNKKHVSLNLVGFSNLIQLGDGDYGRSKKVCK